MKATITPTTVCCSRNGDEKRKPPTVHCNVTEMQSESESRGYECKTRIVYSYTAAVVLVANATMNRL